jgi:hypothetical protein
LIDRARLRSRAGPAAPRARPRPRIGLGRGPAGRARGAALARLPALEDEATRVSALKACGIEAQVHDLDRGTILCHGESSDVVIADPVLAHAKDVFLILHDSSGTLRVGGHLIPGDYKSATLHNRLLRAACREPSPLRTGAAPPAATCSRSCTAASLTAFASSNCAAPTSTGSPPAFARPLARPVPTRAREIVLRLEQCRLHDHGLLDRPRRERLETPFFLGRA